MSSGVALADDPATVHLGGSEPLRRWVEMWAGQPPMNLLVSIEGPREMLSGEYPGTYPTERSAAVVANAAAVANSSGPTHYDVVPLNERIALVARDASKTPGALLDVRIDLPERSRTVLEAMGEWAAAVQAATGDKIVLDSGLTTRSSTTTGGSGVIARESLASILDAQHPALVWTLRWTGDAWFLGVRTVWSVAEKTPPRGVDLNRWMPEGWEDF